MEEETYQDHVVLEATATTNTEEVVSDVDENNNSEVDVTTVTSEELEPEQIEKGSVVEEFLGSSLSGRSIYAAPRVRRVEDGATSGTNGSSSELAAGGSSSSLDQAHQPSTKSQSTTSAASSSGAAVAAAAGSADQLLPDWKRKLVEKKKEEAREKEREKEIWESIPVWQRKLLENKKSKDHSTEESVPCNIPNVGDGAASGARFWGITLKKTKGSSDKRELERADDGDDENDDDDDGGDSSTVQDIDVGSEPVATQ